jgi:hypothetical protein
VLLEGELPAHPLSPQPANSRQRTASDCDKRFRPRSNESPISPKLRKASETFEPLRRTSVADVVFVAIVSVDVAVAPFAVRDAGAKVQVECVARPLQASVTVPVNPPDGAIVMVVETVPPLPLIVAFDRDSVTLKSGGAAVIMTVMAEDVEPTYVPSPA